MLIVKWLQNCALFPPTSASGLDAQVGPSVEEALCKGKSAPDLGGLAATGVLWPRLLAAVKRIEEALPLAGAPEAEAEQRRRLEALRLELPDGHSVGCSYWLCVDVPAASVVYVLSAPDVCHMCGALRLRTVDLCRVLCVAAHRMCTSMSTTMALSGVWQLCCQATHSHARLKPSAEARVPRDG